MVNKGWVFQGINKKLQVKKVLFMTRELLITYDYTTDDLHKELQIIFNYTLHSFALYDIKFCYNFM